MAGWPVILWAFNKGVNIFDEKYLPYYLMVQWYLLPVNVVFFGLFTILLFPITIGAVAFTQYIYKPYLEPVFAQMEAENNAKYAWTNW